MDYTDAVIKETQESYDATIDETLSQTVEAQEGQELIEKRPSHSRTRKRLLLPYERSQGQNKEKESKRKKTYKKLSNQDKRTIRFAKSIMDSINHLDSRSTIHDIEDSIFVNHDIVADEQTPDEQLDAAYLTHFYRTNPPTSQSKKYSQKVLFTKPDMWSIPEESIFGIIAGEEPIPIPKGNEDAFRAIQGQLDEYIVSHLPEEFWGSQFYLDSTTELNVPSFDISRYAKYKKADKKLIQKMVSKANSIDMNLLRFYNKRFSRKRTAKYLDALCDRFAKFIDEETLQNARERMESLSKDLFTRPAYKKRNVV